MLEQSDYFQNLLHAERLPGGFFVYHADGDEELIFFNHFLPAYFGCSSSEEFRAYVGNSFRGMVHPEDLESVEAKIKAQISESSDDLDHVEYRIIRKDGSIGYLNDYGHFAHTETNGDVFYVFVEDVSEKVAMEKELQREAQAVTEFSSIADALAESYESVRYVNLTTGAYKTFNIGGNVSHFGLPETGSDFFSSILQIAEENVHEEDREYVKKFLNRERLIHTVGKKGKDVSMPHRLIIDGKPIYYRLKVLRGKTDDNHLIFSTENVDHAARLERDILRTRASDEAKTEFLFNMSHDVRTPMNAIIGFTKMAMNSMDSPEKLKSCLNKVEVSSRHLLSLINDVLDMSRIEANEVEINEAPVCITEIAGEIVELAQETTNKDLTFVTDHSGVRNRFVYADRLRVKRALMNLLSNAVKFTNDGGTVQFLMKETESRREGYSTYVFIVEDNGMGMSREFLSHLFEEFSRERTSTVSGQQGTGLGMAITKRLVELMNGTIQVKSEPGVGTRATVCLELKIADSIVPQKHEEPEIDVSGLKGKKILVVEDNELNREIAKEILEELELEVTEAEDGTIAVEKMADLYRQAVREDYFDYVLMDIQMPLMDGHEATRRIRAMRDPFDVHIPIIAMTANASVEDRRKSFESGMDYHLAKPINVEELKKALFRFAGEISE